MHAEAGDQNKERGIHASFVILLPHSLRRHVVLLWPSGS